MCHIFLGIILHIIILKDITIKLNFYTLSNDAYYNLSHVKNCNNVMQTVYYTTGHIIIMIIQYYISIYTFTKIYINLYSILLHSKIFTKKK